jgi:hypothetical protein
MLALAGTPRPPVWHSVAADSLPPAHFVPAPALQGAPSLSFALLSQPRHSGARIVTVRPGLPAPGSKEATSTAQGWRRGTGQAPRLPRRGAGRAWRCVAHIRAAGRQGGKQHARIATCCVRGGRFILGAAQHWGGTDKRPQQPGRRIRAGRRTWARAIAGGAPGGRTNASWRRGPFIGIDSVFGLLAAPAGCGACTGGWQRAGARARARGRGGGGGCGGGEGAPRSREGPAWASKQGGGEGGALKAWAPKVWSRRAPKQGLAATPGPQFCIISSLGGAQPPACSGRAWPCAAGCELHSLGRQLPRGTALRSAVLARSMAAGQRRLECCAGLVERGMRQPSI